LRALATELNWAEQRERQRMATELHDHLQQMLVLGKLKLNRGKQAAQALPTCVAVMQEVDEVLSAALSYTRTLVSDLYPTILKEHGLTAGLIWLGNSMSKYDLSVTVHEADRCDAHIPEAHAILLFQSVRELLINTWKHAQVDKADVVMTHGDGHLNIQVHDTGLGFDLAATERRHSGISSKFGLFSIRERMNALGGSFDIQSVSGKGTTATLTLPLGTSAELSVSTPLPKERPVTQSHYNLTLSTNGDGRSSKTIRVLLVDDHVMVRQGLRSVLEGYTDLELVGEAGDGEEAVILAEKLRPAIVLMDINMPKMNGFEATAEIKRNNPSVTVIGLSVKADSENRSAMLKAGASMVLPKEAAVDELHTAIQTAVESRRADDIVTAQHR
jgi:CheY-like chemotaxis protein